MMNSLYRILHVRRADTKYGVRVVLELEENQLFLPTRYDDLSDNILKAMNEQKNFYLRNLGVIGKTYNLSFSQLVEGESAEENWD